MIPGAWLYLPLLGPHSEKNYPQRQPYPAADTPLFPNVGCILVQKGQEEPASQRPVELLLYFHLGLYQCVLLVREQEAG